MNGSSIHDPGPVQKSLTNAVEEDAFEYGEHASIHLPNVFSVFSFIVWKIPHSVARLMVPKLVCFRIYQSLLRAWLILRWFTIGILAWAIDVSVIGIYCGLLRGRAIWVNVSIELCSHVRQCLPAKTSMDCGWAAELLRRFLLSFSFFPTPRASRRWSWRALRWQWLFRTHWVLLEIEEMFLGRRCHVCVLNALKIEQLQIRVLSFKMF